MAKPGNTGITRLLNATRYSAQGIRAAWNSEEAFRQELTLMLAMIPAAFWLGRNAVDVNLGNLRSVNVVQAGDRTRVVLNLKAATSYRAQVQGKSLLVTLEPVAVAGPSSVPAPAFAETRNRDTQPLKDLDFRRGADGIRLTSVCAQIGHAINLRDN